MKRGEEIKRPKRKVIRVESEETQDYKRIIGLEPGGQHEGLCFVVTIGQ